MLKTDGFVDLPKLNGIALDAAQETKTEWDNKMKHLTRTGAEAILAFGWTRQNRITHQFRRNKIIQRHFVGWGGVADGATSSERDTTNAIHTRVWTSMDGCFARGTTLFG